MELDYQTLAEAVGGGSVGLRARTLLEPLGGPGDKVFPPTYGVQDRAETKYATEKRRVAGESVDAVVLSSVASQANHMELGLLDAIRDGALSLPLVSVDFSSIRDLAGFDRISSLEASHRIFDAVLRDSLHGEVLFRLGAVGQQITEATNRDAAALYRYNPATLLFGGWDSTGPKGGRGSKYERAITSEIVALGIERGVKTASRIDAVGIELKAGPLYEAEDQSLGEWTTDQAEARKDKSGKPKLLTGGGDSPGRPSQVNHGNVTPSIDERAGGVTVDRIEATTVLSFAALRKLRFPTDTDGQPLAQQQRKEAETAARTTLAALGVAAVALLFEGGFDLRSRCVLVPTQELEFELLGRAGESRRFTTSRDSALTLVAESQNRAEKLGLSWENEELLLRPTDRLVELIRRSRALAATEPADA
ncbi:MAG: type I-G CRISPR-associated RAMP protein Csb1/Cas7g [Geodermatophilaceae bacterium]